ncbi:hypothetical protein FOZ60_013019 [Perkinsus olseni]|uniref:Uncharacterized protein n=1 Tax=Perkinsus olseni TaxID=32597 RepID=A0A7J6NA35_PEROL|nr:hypothetical protein FOZ60_013019 [Perkinsus olseni]
MAGSSYSRRKHSVKRRLTRVAEQAKFTLIPEEFDILLASKPRLFIEVAKRWDDSSRRLAPRPERGLIGRAVNQGASVTADDDEAAALSTSDENIEDPVAVEDQQVRGEVPVQGLPLAGKLDAEERLRRAAVVQRTLDDLRKAQGRSVRDPKESAERQVDTAQQVSDAAPGLQLDRSPPRLEAHSLSTNFPKCPAQLVLVEGLSATHLIMAEYENIEDPVAVEDQQVRGEVPVQGKKLFAGVSLISIFWITRERNVLELLSEEGLSRDNKRRHKAICTALNRVCIHLDICRLLHLTLPRTSTELNEKCTIQWEAAAEMYHAVAHELDSLHHTDGDLKAAEIEVAPHPDIPLLPWDFWRWFVLPRALREIPFNELQDRCLKYLDLHLDSDDFEELQSRARLTRPREQEDRRYLLLETRLRAAEHSRKAQHKDGCELSKPSSASRPEEGPVILPVRELRDFITSPPPKLRRGMLKNRYPVIPIQEDMKELLEYMRNQPMPSTEIEGAASHVEQEPSIAAEIDDSIFETPPPQKSEYWFLGLRRP